MIPPVSAGWDASPVNGPYGMVHRVQYGGGWVYSIFTPNAADTTQGAQPPFFVPDIAVWSKAIGSAIVSAGGTGGTVDTTGMNATLQSILAFMKDTQARSLLPAIEADIRLLAKQRDATLETLIQQVQLVNVAMQQLLAANTVDTTLIDSIAADIKRLTDSFINLTKPRKIVLDLVTATDVMQPKPTRAGP